MYYFTMEHNVGNGTALISDLKVSNLPNVGYDTDDDDGDGYYEEAEAYESGTPSLQANKDYYFIAWWDKDTSAVPAGTVSTVAQRSFDLGEMQTMHYDLLTQKSYGALRTIQESSFSEYMEGESGKLLVNEDVTSIEALEELKKNQYSQVQQLIANGDLVGRSVEATITFDVEITLKQLKELLHNNQAELVTYESKFVNEDGEWITAEHTTLDTDRLVSNVNKALEEKEKEITYVGVTSAKIDLILEDDIYNNIITDELVYFLDLSSSLMSNNARTVSSEYIVTDYAYLLANSR